MKTILHIGTDKTGSTAVQRAMFRNRPWLLEKGIYIPETGLGVDNGHAVLLQALKSENLATLRSELMDAHEKGFTAAIISWEGMSRFSPKQIKVLRSALSSCDVSILVYLREQAELIQSAHLQWVQMNASAIAITSLAEPASPFQRLRKTLFLRQPKRNYQALLKRWLRCLQPESIDIRTFDPTQLHDGDVISDFAHYLGIQLDEEFVREIHPINASLDVETALMLEQWRRQKLSRLEIETRLDIALAVASTQEKCTRYFFDEPAVNAMRRHYRASNEAATKIMKVNVPEGLFLLRDCWRQETWEQVTQRASFRETLVEQAATVPTLWGASAGASLVQDIKIDNGWSTPEAWGIWSDAPASRLRFRLPLRVLQLGAGSIDLQILGRYYGKNAVTLVTVNGFEHGEIDLSDLSTKIRVNENQIGADRHIDIELRHQSPSSPYDFDGSDDHRCLAFALCSIAYQPIRLA